MKSKGPKCRLCRREKEKLFLKGERCITGKCSVARRQGYDKKPTLPGQHTSSRKKLSDYGVQLREKQKARKVYGIRETQFVKYFEAAEKKKGITGEDLLVLLERRLDSVVCRAGMASSRSCARQYIGHGHIVVSGRKVDIPSYLVKVGDEISFKVSSKIAKVKSDKEVDITNLPPWMAWDESTREIKITSFPSREDIDARLKEQLIVEYYSR